MYWLELSLIVAVHLSLLFADAYLEGDDDDDVDGDDEKDDDDDDVDDICVN